MVWKSLFSQFQIVQLGNSRREIIVKVRCQSVLGLIVIVTVKQVYFTNKGALTYRTDRVNKRRVSVFIYHVDLESSFLQQNAIFVNNVKIE